MKVLLDTNILIYSATPNAMYLQDWLGKMAINQKSAPSIVQGFSPILTGMGQTGRSLGLKPKVVGYPNPPAEAGGLGFLSCWQNLRLDITASCNNSKAISEPVSNTPL